MSLDRAIALDKAVRILNLNQRQLADYLGLSLRTVQRRLGEGWTLDTNHFHKLARGIYPHDPALAGSLAAFGGTTVEALGLNAAPSAALVATAVHVDAVICAAAEAADLTPRALRPAIAAAFARAVEIGLPAEAFHRAMNAGGARRSAKG